MAELEADGRRELLILAGGRAGTLLALSEEARRGLLAAGAPASVSAHVVAPLAGGTVGGVRWVLEPRARGAHPRRLGRAARSDCLAFLVGLREARAGAERVPVADLEALRPHLADAGLVTLERVGAALEERLAAVPRGWCHGDFWTGNLLVARGRLTAVLDWDAATPGGLPLLDLLHLMAYADRATRRLPHGLRCTRRLWPLARAGGDAQVRAYCGATGTPADAATLEALAVAYWLERVARDLRTFADRAGRASWMADNVHAPLRELEVLGW
jgi:Phosphotransferase enzyme family